MDHSSPSHFAEPELSVVLPCFNEVDTIERQLREWSATLEATVPDHELVVINDGSSDGTGKILDKCRKELKAVRVIHQLNGGHSRAIRRGYELARGRYVMQADTNGMYEAGDFKAFWDKRNAYELIQGVRPNWVEGKLRRALLNLLRGWVRFLFGSTLEDPNVPFRLFRREVAASYLAAIPPEFEGVNLTLSILMQRDYPQGICELPLPRRSRPPTRPHARFKVFAGMITHFLWEATQLRFSKRFAPDSRHAGQRALEA